jgi:hypothetical protein
MILSGLISDTETVSKSLVGIAFIAGLVLLFAGILIGAVGSQVLVPKRIDEHFVWLSRVSPDYLAKLPDWNAPGDVAL